MIKNTFTKLITILIAFSSYSHTAVAAEFFVIPGTKTLLMMGETIESDRKQLVNHLINDKIDSMILKGPGGDLEAGYAIADVILKTKLKVTIPADTTCASACSLIFASGDIRVMEENSKLGFHLPFATLNNDEATRSWCRSLQSKKDNTLWGNLLNIVDGSCLEKTYQMGLRDIRRLNYIIDRDGISEKVLDLIVDTPSGSMAWIDRTKAKELGLIKTSKKQRKPLL